MATEEAVSQVTTNSYIVLSRPIEAVTYLVYLWNIIPLNRLGNG